MMTQADVEQCECDSSVRCVECGGCDCLDNPGVCDGPGCISVDSYLQAADEFQWAGDSYGLLSLSGRGHPEGEATS